MHVNARSNPIHERLYVRHASSNGFNHLSQYLDEKNEDRCMTWTDPHRSGRFIVVAHRCIDLRIRMTITLFCIMMPSVTPTTIFVSHSSALSVNRSLCPLCSRSNVPEEGRQMARLASNTVTYRLGLHDHIDLLMSTGTNCYCAWRRSLPHCRRHSFRHR